MDNQLDEHRVWVPLPGTPIGSDHELQVAAAVHQLRLNLQASRLC